jgi:hypothetical protein
MAREASQCVVLELPHLPRPRRACQCVVLELSQLLRPRRAFRFVLPELLRLHRLLGQSSVLDWSCRIYHDFFKFQCVELELTAHIAVRVDLYMEDTLWGEVSFAARRALLA